MLTSAPFSTIHLVISKSDPSLIVTIKGVPRVGSILDKLGRFCFPVLVNVTSMVKKVGEHFFRFACGHGCHVQNSHVLTRVYPSDMSTQGSNNYILFFNQIFNDFKI